MRQFAAVRPAHEFTPAFLILFFSFLVSGCGTTLELPSHWADIHIEIDGSLREWTDSTTFVEKDGIRCGVMHDKEYIYVCIMSSTPNLGRQLIMRGLTVWFDPNGGEKKSIGVRFPIVAMRSGMMRPAFGDRPAREERDQAPADRRQRYDETERQSLQEFEFLGPGPDDRQRVLRMQGQGIVFHLTSTPERFVYEMKIPLAYSSQHPHAVESYPGSVIGIGFDSTPQERAMGGAPGGEVPEGAPPGGGRTGGGGGIPGGERPDGMQPPGNAATFSFWTHVQLADKAK
jgi:hypothetical protein